MRYNFDALTQAEIEELISAKVEKEANRYIQNWEAEKISIQNGRWGPFIKFGKENVKLIDLKSGKKIEADEAAALSLDEVKKIIEKALPDAFAPKKTSTKKAATAKKTSTKKTSSKK